MGTESLEGQVMALQGVVTYLVTRIARTDEQLREARDVVAGAIESYYEGRALSEDRHKSLQIALEFVEQMLAPNSATPRHDRG